jgi:adhesin transport system outer membrane protein
MLNFRVRDFWHRSLISCLLYAGSAAHADGLGNALQATLRNHPAVAGQQAQVEAKRYVTDQARSQRYPTLSARARTEGGDSIASNDDSSEPSVLRARQPVWAFGRIRNNISFANAEMSTEQADLLRVRRELMEHTAVAYAQVRGSEENIDIARQNVAEHAELLAQIERRMEGQLATSADARLAAARLLQARVMLERAISEWQGAQDDLMGLTQVRVTANESVPTDLLALSESAHLLEWAMEYSAEILLKEQQVGQAEAEVEKAKTSSMPTIYLQADRFYDQPDDRDDSQVSLVFEASLDGLGFAAKGRRGEAAAGHLAARQDLSLAKIELKQELEHLQRKRRLQSELIELQTMSLKDLESLLASYQRQYESGTKSWLDLLNIQRELFEQRRQLVQAHNEWVIYSLQLQARIGGLDDLADLEELQDG